MAITLNDFLTPLVTTNIQVVVKDLEEETICKIFADSVVNLNSDLSARTINRWDIIRNNLIKIYLNNEEVIEIIPVTGIELSTKSIPIEIGESYTLIPIISPENATNKNVNWLSMDENIVTVNNGVLSAIGEGTTSVIVSTEDGDYSDVCEVSVVAKTIHVESIRFISNLMTISIDSEPFELEYVISPLEATDKSVTWVSSDESIITVDNGIITPISNGIATVTVTTVDGGYSDVCGITVEESEVVHVESVNIVQESLDLEVGQEATELLIEITPDNATDKSVVWSTSDDTIIGVDNGFVTPISEGTAIVTVQTVDGKYTDTCECNVSIPQIEVESVQLNETEITITLGNTDFPKLVATVLPSDASYSEIIWTSSDESIVTVSNGELTPIAIGEANVIATVNDISSEACRVTVIEE